MYQASTLRYIKVNRVSVDRVWWRKSLLKRQRKKKNKRKKKKANRGKKQKQTKNKRKREIKTKNQSVSWDGVLEDVLLPLSQDVLGVAKLNRATNSPLGNETHRLAKDIVDRVVSI